jgi:hypothetical protein
VLQVLDYFKTRCAAPASCFALQPTDALYTVIDNLHTEVVAVCQDIVYCVMPAPGMLTDRDVLQDRWKASVSSSSWKHSIFPDS